MYLGDPPTAKVIMFSHHAPFDEQFAITFILGDPPNAKVIMFSSSSFLWAPTRRIILGEGQSRNLRMM